MNNSWQLIYSSPYNYQVELAKAVLSNHDIESVILNRKDSAYLIGEFELYVLPEDVLRAKQIINKENL